MALYCGCLYVYCVCSDVVNIARLLLMAPIEPWQNSTPFPRPIPAESLGAPVIVIENNTKEDDDLQNEDDPKMKMTSKMKMTPKVKTILKIRGLQK